MHDGKRDAQFSSSLGGVGRSGDSAALGYDPIGRPKEQCESKFDSSNIEERGREGGREGQHTIISVLFVCLVFRGLILWFNPSHVNIRHRLLINYSCFFISSSKAEEVLRLINDEGVPPSHGNFVGQTAVSAEHSR